MTLRIQIIIYFILQIGLQNSQSCNRSGRPISDRFLLPDSTYKIEKYDNYFYNNFDVIFLGKLTKVIYPKDFFLSDIIEYQFEIIEPIKGIKNNNLISIYSHITSGNCDLFIVVGDFAIIWGYKKNGFFTTSVFIDGCYPNYSIKVSNHEYYKFVSEKKYLNQHDSLFDLKKLISYTKYNNEYVEYYFSNKRLSCKGNYHNGKPEGLWQYFDLNGNLKEFGYYKDGLRNGKWFYFDRNVILAIQLFEDGFMEGESKYYMNPNYPIIYFYKHGNLVPEKIKKYLFLENYILIIAIILPLLMFIFYKWKINKL